MFFRENDSSSDSSVDPDEVSSSGGSLASSESYATRAFEKRMRFLLAESPIADTDFQDGTTLPNGPEYSTDDAIRIKEKDMVCGVDAVEGEEQVSCINCNDGADWALLMRKLDSVVDSEPEFYEYPSPDSLKTCSSQQTAGGEAPSGDSSITSTHGHHHGTKMFIGGLRFEVVQSGRQMISWIFEVACGVRLPPNSILVHRRAKGGRSGSPTGCASVFVANEQDVEKLLSMNQRIFCGEKGIYVASSVEHMTGLIASKVVLNVSDGRIRGPTHPVVIERAYGSAGNPASRNSITGTPNKEHTPSGLPPPYETATSLNSVPGASPLQLSSNASSLPSSMSISVGLNVASTGDGATTSTTTTAAAPTGDNVLLKPTKKVPYNQYPGDITASQSLQHISIDLKRPVALFVGGFPGEANREFIAWVFSLLRVPVHPTNITLYVDSQSGEKGGCAYVRVEESDVAKATAWSKRVLCDPHGVYFAESPRVLPALLAARDKTAPPARPLIIKRKDTGRGVPRSTALPMGPPPPFPGTWDPTQPQQVLGWQPAAPARPPPPPYMQSVIIGNQTYQVPVGASIQLQLVPVITAPGMAPTAMPIQAAPAAAAPPPPPPPPMYQPMPPPPPPPPSLR
ncbi:uncharacterized protein TM35_000051480 [Trypanosoma theileri]|uniref:Uncharacterized protein n=1 Tax=Trypanosoma theileri TaxID=67003 RepID=A0A1X0P3Q4_9TRYP|nr:uncharacterized protein TM35_000051480 [Trypanosoma theileri]ORC91552.1 hypothetical protein TM35_000051480 [Trypanosoma theileri]